MSDIRRLLMFPFRAPAMAEDLQRRPHWLIPFLSLALVTVAIQVIVHPDEVQRTVTGLPPSATPADQEHIRQALDASLPARMAFLPFRLFAGWSATALLLFVMIKSFRPVHQPRFVHLLALEIHAESVNVFGLLVRGACIVAGIAASTVPEGLPLSAMIFAPHADDFIIRTLLSSINLHTLWYVWIVGCGVSVLFGFRKRKALLFSAVVWMVAMGCNLAIIQVLRDALHLRL